MINHSIKSHDSNNNNHNDYNENKNGNKGMSIIMASTLYFFLQWYCAFDPTLNVFVDSTRLSQMRHFFSQIIATNDQVE